MKFPFIFISLNLDAEFDENACVRDRFVDARKFNPSDRIVFFIAVILCGCVLCMYVLGALDRQVADGKTETD